MRCAGLTICALRGNFTLVSRSHCWKQQRQPCTNGRLPHDSVTKYTAISGRLYAVYRLKNPPKFFAYAQSLLRQISGMMIWWRLRPALFQRAESVRWTKCSCRSQSAWRTAHSHIIHSQFRQYTFTSPTTTCRFTQKLQPICEELLM